MFSRRFFPFLALCLLLSACGPAARFVVRDSKRSSEIKKIAIAPFFNANTLDAEKGRESPFTDDFTEQARKKLSKKYEFIRYPPERAGLSIPEALKIGKELGADAIIIGAGAKHENKVLKKLYKSTLSIRLIDVKTGKVLWGASALKKGMWDSSPSKKIVSLMAREALR